MAPNKLEDRIREQLQERELTPSSDAWSRMEARLGTPKKSGSKRMVWFAIAASFTGLLILATLFFNNDSSNSEMVVEDVEQSVPEVIEEAAEEIVAPEIRETEIAVEDVEAEAPVATDKEIISKDVEEAVIINNNVSNEVIGKEAIAKVEGIEEPEVNVKEEVVDIIKQEPKSEEEMFFQQKVDEVVAQIESEGVEVSPEEVDNLLLEAQKEISKRRILNSKNRKVDAAALLSDVELELERSFRDKVFDALGEGFNKIRTAVVERNN